MHLHGGTLTFIGQFSVLTKTSRFHCIGGTGEYQSVTDGVIELEAYSFDEVALDAILIVTIYYHK